MEANADMATKVKPILQASDCEDTEYGGFDGVHEKASDMMSIMQPPSGGFQSRSASSR